MSSKMTYTVFGRVVDLMAIFPNTDKGMRDANEYMERTPGASVLANTDAIYIAHKDDKGRPLTQMEA